MPLPLAGLVRRLRAAGFAMDAGREFQLRRVLHEQGSDYVGRFSELKYALAPYIATNANEQRRFYQLWEDYLKELEHKLEEPETKTSKEDVRRGNYITILLLGLVAALIGWYLFNILTKPDLPEHSPILVELQQDAEARAGQPLQVRNATLLEQAYDSTHFTWQFLDGESGRVLAEADSVFQYDFTVPDSMAGRRLEVVLSIAAQTERQDSILEDRLSLAVLCQQAPYVEGIQLPAGTVRKDEQALFELRGDPESGVEYIWLVGGDTLKGPTVNYTFLAEGKTAVQLLARRIEDAEFCFTLLPPRNIQVGTNLPVFPIIPLRRDVERQVLYASSWLYLLPVLFGLLGYFFILRRYWNKEEKENREKTDEELAEEYPFYDEGPYVIPYQDQSGQISVPADFFRIADQLRIREKGVRMVFDGRATVEATIKAGGFPAWRERAVKRPANYLVLLRHTDEFHQQDRLLKRLTDFLLVREAALEVYYHAGDFSWFWNEAYPNGWSPDQLKSRYGEHRLILMGDAHGLIDAFHRGDPRLLPSKERWFHRWARRLVLTTEPVVDWSFQEVLLHRHTLLYPATTDGILRGVSDLNTIEEYQNGSYKRWKAERLRRDPEPSYRYRTWKTIGDHQAYLEDDPDLFRWLTALSVVAHPDWSLTIAIGRALGLEVTHDRLLRLSRIPWLAANSPDQGLRLEFLERLNAEDEVLARGAALEQLEIVSAEVANTFAASEWTANQAVQSFALAPNDEANQGKVRDLRRMGLLAPDQLEELNLVAERQFPQQKTRSQSTSGDQLYLDRLLEQEEEIKPIFSDREKQLLGLIMACLLLCLPMFLYNRAVHELPAGEEPEWWQVVENPTDAAHQALEKNNAAALYAGMLARSKNYTEYASRQGTLDRFIASALDSALQLMNGDYPLADSNLTAFGLNQKAYLVNWLVADSLVRLPGQNANLGPLLTDMTGLLQEKYGAADPYTLQALHLEGINEWWNYQSIYQDAEDTQSAIDRFRRAGDIKQRIEALDPNYFTSLADSMPVHLAYLLARDSAKLTRDLRATVDFADLSITVKVIDKVGAPVAGAAVKVIGTPTANFTNQDGNLRLKVPESLGFISAAFGDYSAEVDLIGPNGELPNRGEVVTIQLDFLFEPQPPTASGNDQKTIYTGMIVDQNGRPLSLTLVSLQSGDKDRTDQNGRFQLALPRDLNSVTLKIGDGPNARMESVVLSNNRTGLLGTFAYNRNQRQ
ncbi:MAG: hypothetical protein AAF840_05290, partial [Bacteroidota bacterium]